MPSPDAKSRLTRKSETTKRIAKGELVNKSDSIRCVNLRLFGKLPQNYRISVRIHVSELLCTDEISSTVALIVEEYSVMLCVLIQLDNMFGKAPEQVRKYDDKESGNRNAGIREIVEYSVK